MLNSFVLTLAIRYFRAKKNERFVSLISGFALLGVTLGVAALIIVMSVMKGFHQEFVKNIIGLNGDINITSNNKEIIENHQNILLKLQNLDYIKHINPVAYGQALALGVKNNNGAMIRGIDYENLKNKKEIIDNIIKGSLDNFNRPNVVALGSELAYVLGVTIGDTLRLISPNTISTMLGSMPRSKEFEVIAIFSSGMYDYDMATILMPMVTAQKFLSLGEAINLIELNSINPEKAEFYARKIQNILGINVNVRSWESTNLQFLNALAIEQTAMFTILSLIILIAAFNIIASLFMLVKDKTKDIAILRTIGATKSQIMSIFILNGSFIGLIGTAIGVILGTSFAYNIEAIRQLLEKITGTRIFDAAIYFLYSLPSEVRMSDVAMIAGFSAIICFLATIYPAYKAASLSPIEALRYE